MSASRSAEQQPGQRAESAASVAQRWLEAEPDADLRDELAELLAGPPAELTARFAGRLQFGTAGLRGAVGAGPLRMNRLVVRQAAAGLVDHLLATVPDAAERGVIIGYDARRKSDVFAMDTARVLRRPRGAGVAASRTSCPRRCSRGTIVGTGAAAGVMVTASHNPPADNGYKVYLGTGAQIVPPVDEQIAGVHRRGRPVLGRARSGRRPAHPRARHRSGRRRTSPRCPRCGSAPTWRARRWPTRRCTASAGRRCSRRSSGPGLAAPVVVAEQQEPDGTFPTVAFPNPEEPGAMDLLLALAAASGAGSRSPTIPTPTGSAPRSPPPAGAVA